MKCPICPCEMNDAKDAIIYMDGKIIWNRGFIQIHKKELKDIYDNGTSHKKFTVTYWYRCPICQSTMYTTDRFYPSYELLEKWIKEAKE